MSPNLLQSPASEDVTLPQTPDRFAGRVLPLLKEYGEKLRATRERFRASLSEYEAAQGWFSSASKRHLGVPEHIALQGYLIKIWPAVTKLVESVSQRLEHSELDDGLQLELKLRLAELESAMEMAEPIKSATDVPR